MEIDGSRGVLPGSAAGVAGHAKATNVFGKMKGEKVHVHLVNKMAILQDAAEELTFVAAEEMERKISERELREERDKRAEKEKLGGGGGETGMLSDSGSQEDATKAVKALAEDIKSQPAVDPKAMLSLVKERHEDVSQQYTALKFVKERLENENIGGEKLEALQSAIDTLVEEQGPEIFAGLNVTPLAQRFVAENKVGNVQDLRDFYRDAVLDYGGLGSTFEKLVEQHGEENFPETLDFLLSGLGADLAAREQSSIAPEQLRAIVDDIQQIRLIGALHEQCVDLLGRLNKNYGAAKNDRPFAVLGEMVRLKESNWVSGGQVLNISERMDLQNFDEKIYFLHGFMDIVKSIPMKAYDGDYDKRQKFVSGAQEAMDEMVMLEEESLGGEADAGTS